jgi:hypothetical protein
LHSYPHTLNYIYSLSPETISIHLANLFTFNFWHRGEEWGVNAYDKTVTHALGHLLFEQKRLNFIADAEFPKLFNHYLDIALPSLKKLIGTNELGSLDQDYLHKLLIQIIQFKL